LWPNRNPVLRVRCNPQEVRQRLPMPWMWAMPPRADVTRIRFANPERCGDFRNGDRCKPWLNLANICRFVRPDRSRCRAPLPLCGLMVALRLRVFLARLGTQCRDASGFCEFDQFALFDISRLQFGQFCPAHARPLPTRRPPARGTSLVDRTQTFQPFVDLGMLPT